MPPRVWTTAFAEHDRWGAVERALIAAMPPSAPTLVSFCDSHFARADVAVLAEPWSGIVHNPFGFEQFTPFDPTPLFSRQSFLASLPTCRTLFVMSYTQLPMLEQALARAGATHVAAHVLYHPLPEVRSTFDPDEWKRNRRTVVSVGNWLRRQHSIFKARVPSGARKALCPWTERTEKELAFYVARDSVTLTPVERKSVDTLARLSDRDYDELFRRSVVLLDTYLTTTNNVLLEAVAHNTPILLNRHREWTALLGEDYPLFFDTLADLPRLLADRTVIAAHEYLRDVCAAAKTRWTADRFVRDVWRFA